MDAETGKTAPFVSVEAHYDALMDEGNDPVLDPPPLRAYMDGWDGAPFFELLDLQPQCRALEIGVGSGRLALRALQIGCRELVGMDLSSKSLRAAAEHLRAYPHVRLIQGEFPRCAPDGPFDRIYSSLTFLHMADKRAAVRKIAELLVPGGKALISLDKARDPVLEMGARRVALYPDDPERIAGLFRECGLSARRFERERAWLILAERPNC